MKQRQLRKEFTKLEGLSQASSSGGENAREKDSQSWQSHVKQAIQKCTSQSTTEIMRAIVSNFDAKYGDLENDLHYEVLQDVATAIVRFILDK